MSKTETAPTTAATELNERDLDQVNGGLLPAVAPVPVIAPTSQPVLPAVQRGLIGLL